MGPSKNQQICIDTIDKPVIVSAGAGSGKTYTLTERIVSALKPDENGKKKINSITQVVAITFTHKAAEELKSRIRHRLNECGLVEDALLVDDAYISTIHGFAARILRENALQFSISPKIELIDSSADVQYMRQAFSLALKGASQGITDRSKMHETLTEYSQSLNGRNIEDVDMNDFVRNLVIVDTTADGPSPNEDEQPENLTTDGAASEFYPQDDYLAAENDAKFIANKILEIFMSLGIGQEDKNFDNFLHSFDKEDGMIAADKLFEMTCTLMDKCSTLPDGTNAFLDDVDYFNLQQLCKKLRTKMRSAIKQLESVDKLSKAEEQYLDVISKAQSSLSTELDSWFHQDMYGSYEQDFIDALRAAATITDKFRSNKEDCDFWAKYKCDLAVLLLEYLCEKTIDDLEQLALTCKNTEIINNAIKGGKYFGNNDLLKCCYRFLKEFPEIATQYKKKFKMIMIDEFQDTDRLQLALIKEVADKSLKNVCTVGDVQQSIYRFRSADVKVFRDYKKEVEKKKSSEIVKLDDNYRSHGDILALTDKIFANDEFFGSEFLHLNAKGNVNSQDDPVFANRPRVRIDVVHNKTTNRKEPEQKCSSLDARRFQAMQIARHFKELIDSGCKPSSFALLLGKMTNANLYQEALLQCGIESLITGGSVFRDSIEAFNVRMLVNLARNFMDDASLLAILKSNILNLSEDSILAISRKIKEVDGAKKIYRTNISSNIFDVDEELMGGLDDKERADIIFAQKLLSEFINNCETSSLEYSIRTFLSSAGVFDMLAKRGPDGLVSAGNYEKSLYILRDICKTEITICAIQQKFNAVIESNNEKPGILSTKNSNFMEIMTIHASKGLEFDHVAIAELPVKDPSIDNLVAYNTSNKTFFSLLPDPDRFNLKDVTKRLLGFEDYIEGECAKLKNGLTAGKLHQSLMNLEREEELEEQKRLLYVAITRAVKSVFLSIQVFKSPPKKDYKKCGLVAGLYDVFGWDLESQHYSSNVDYGGSAPAQFNFHFLPFSSSFQEFLTNDEVVQNSSVASQVVPIREINSNIEDHATFLEENKYYSYSTLAEYSDSVYLDFIRDMSRFRCSIDEDDEQIAYPWEIDGDKATDFGTIFHAYMERIVLQTSDVSQREPDKRLKSAIEKTLSCPEFERVVSQPQVVPEMPFFVKFNSNGSNEFLRGAIDLVGIDNNKAFVIDYKTGTNPKDHTLQAIVYAYAILKNGIEEVDIDFLHCEIPRSNEPSYPELQSFHFTANDIDSIEKEIAQCIKKSKR